nr:helix-turn-helix domain-containing protein [Rhodococcus sp. BL-253-APC-6A1W]
MHSLRRADSIAAVTFGPFDARQAPGELARLLDELGPDTAVTIGLVPALLTIAQVADVLGCSRRYAARLVDTGALPAEFHGLHRRVPRTEVLALGERHTRIRTEVLDNLADLTRREGMYEKF